MIPVYNWRLLKYSPAVFLFLVSAEASLLRELFSAQIRLEATFFAVPYLRVLYSVLYLALLAVPSSTLNLCYVHPAPLLGTLEGRVVVSEIRVHTVPYPVVARTVDGLWSLMERLILLPLSPLLVLPKLWFGAGVGDQATC